MDAENQAIAGHLRKVFPNECKRVLIINPVQVPEQNFDSAIAKSRNYPCFPPYGAGVLCRHLENKSYETDIIDLNYDVLAEANRNGKFSYRCWKEKLAEKIRKFSPDAAGISCMFSMTHHSMKDTADFLKSVNPALPVIVGGVHPSMAPKQVLQDCKSVDLISLYESDISFPNLLDIVNGKINSDRLRQVAMIIEGEYAEIMGRETPTIEIDAPPLYHHLNIGDYSSCGRIGAEARLMLPKATKIGTVISNRGCRGSCTFCSVNNFNGKGVRHRSVDSVVNEIEELRDRYGVRHIMWLDDDLLSDKKRTRELFREMKKRKLNITWDASNGLVASAVDDETMDAAVKSGCIYLNLGIESGSPEILKSTRKPSGVKHFIRASKVLKEYPHIFTRGFLMLGFPGETIGQVKQTIDLAKKMSLDWYSIQPLMILPSTKIAQEERVDGKKFTDGTIKCFIGSTGNQRLIEQKEKHCSDGFEDLLQRSDDYIPTAGELKDVWFLADYRINFESIPHETNPTKLGIKEKMLAEICERKTKENPLASYFLGIVKEKLGKTREAGEYFRRAEQYLNASAFWRTRLKIIGLEKLILEKAQ